MPNQNVRKRTPYTARDSDKEIMRVQMEINEVNRKLANARRWRKHDRIRKFEAELKPLQRKMARIVVGSHLTYGDRGR